MLIDMKSKADDERVLNLLEHAVFPDEEELRRTADAYKSESNKQLYAYTLEDDLIGIIGFTNWNGRIEIHHLAVHPKYRGLGYGRGILLELIALTNPRELYAVTDDDAVDFYRYVGFAINSLGEVYPGRERFQCVYQIDDSEE